MERIKKVTKSEQQRVAPPAVCQQRGNRAEPPPVPPPRAAGYEVVEIDGFTFKRRRTGVPAENEGPNAGQGGALLKTPHGQRALQGLAAAAQSPGVDVCDLSRELYQRLSAGLAALPEAAPASQHLATFADSVCGAEADRAAGAGNPAAAKALAEVFAAFRVSLAAALAEGRVSCAFRAPGAGGGGATPQGGGGGGGGEEVDQAGAGYHVDLAVRKAGLRARLANFAKVRAGNLGRAAPLGLVAPGAAWLAACPAVRGAFWQQERAAQLLPASAACRRRRSGSRSCRRWSSWTWRRGRPPPRPHMAGPATRRPRSRGRPSPQRSWRCS